VGAGRFPSNSGPCANCHDGRREPRLARTVGPWCWRATMCSIWNGATEACASGSRQYSQRKRARRRTALRSSGSITASWFFQAVDAPGTEGWRSGRWRGQRPHIPSVLPESAGLHCTCPPVRQSEPAFPGRHERQPRHEPPPASESASAAPEVAQELKRRGFNAWHGAIISFREFSAAGLQEHPHRECSRPSGFARGRGVSAPARTLSVPCGRVARRRVLPV